MIDFIASNHTLLVVVAGTIFLGLASGAIGTIFIQRKQALVGDVLSHATLPGVVLAFIITGEKSIVVLLLGAFVFSVLAMSLLTVIKKYSKIKNDAIMALVLSSFFGIGQVFLVLIQGSANAAQAGLDKFIFGQAATMILADVITVSLIAFIILLLMFVFWKEIKHFVFNKEHYQSLGYSVKIINFILSMMIIVVVVIGIRMVGVILMSALLIIPGVASRQWSNKLSLNVALAAGFGMIAGAIGTTISATHTNMPTGPVVVIVLSVIMMVSLLFAPNRGLIFQAIKTKEYNKRLIKYKPLIHLYVENPVEMISSQTLDSLKKEVLIDVEHNNVKLTKRGIALVRSLLGGEKNEY